MLEVHVLEPSEVYIMDGGALLFPWTAHRMDKMVQYMQKRQDGSSFDLSTSRLGQMTSVEHFLACATFPSQEENTKHMAMSAHERTGPISTSGSAAWRSRPRRSRRSVRACARRGTRAFQVKGSAEEKTVFLVQGIPGLEFQGVCVL